MSDESIDAVRRRLKDRLDKHRWFTQHEAIQTRFDERFDEWRSVNDRLDEAPADPVEERNLMERSLELSAESQAILDELSSHAAVAFERWPDLLDEFVDYVAPAMVTDVERLLDGD